MMSITSSSCFESNTCHLFSVQRPTSAVVQVHGEKRMDDIVRLILKEKAVNVMDVNSEVGLGREFVPDQRSIRKRLD